MANLSRTDLNFILQQILIAEADSAAQRGGNDNALPGLVGNLIAVIFVTAISTLFNTTGLEVATGREANLERVVACLHIGRNIDDELYIPRLDTVDNMRPALVHLIDPFSTHSRLGQPRRSAFGRENAVTRRLRSFQRRQKRKLCRIIHGNENRPFFR